LKEKKEFNAEATENAEDTPTGVGAGAEHTGRSTEVTEEKADSRQLTVHRQERRQRVNNSASPEENAAPKRKKGETAVEPQIHLTVIITKLERFARPNSGNST
jgi:hypothetical protein